MLSAKSPATRSTQSRCGNLAIISPGSRLRPIKAPATCPAIDAMVSVSPPLVINSIKTVLKSKIRARLAPHKARGTDSMT